MDLQTKSLDVVIEKANSAEYDARFVMSAVTPDRVKDTIDPKAYEPNLGKKLIALYQHDHDKPIGFWDNLRVEAGKLKGDIKFATTNLAQMVKTLISDGVPLGASIGFRGRGEANKVGGIHFKELELLECSVVSVPAHPSAMQIAKSFGVEIEFSDDAGSDEPPVVVETKRNKAAAALAVANATLSIKGHSK